MTERLRALRVPRGRTGEAIVLAIAYAVTAGYLVSRAVDVHSYVWLIDEFLYVKGALGFADGHLTGHVFGEATSVHAPLYSWLLAPIYGLLRSNQAFKAAHGVDALVFAGVLIPVYLTARYLGARPLMALLAGLLSTWVPWSAATLLLMSESLCYLAFAWAVWAAVRAVAEPSPGRDALALLFMGATAYTRPQFALLFPAFVLAVMACEFGADDDRPLRERLRPHWLLGVVALVGIVVVAVAGRSLLGGYSQTAGLPRFPQGLWQNMAAHAAHIVVGAGLIPAIFWLGWVLRAGDLKFDRRQLAFAVLSCLLVALVFYQVGFFSQNVVGGRVQERTAFYVVPLFALGLAAMSADLRPRAPRLSLTAAGAVLALVIGGAPFTTDEASATFEAMANPGASYNAELQSAVGDISGALGHHLPTVEGLALVAILLGALATVAAAPGIRRVGLPVAAVLALVFCMRETTTVLARDVTGVNAAMPAVLGTPSPPRAWVDDALPGSDEVGAVESPLFPADSYSVWLWLEFWNKSVTRLYVPPGVEPYSDLPALTFDVREATGAVRAPHEQRYLVVAESNPLLALQGRVIKQGPYGLTLLEPRRPYQAAWAVVGGAPASKLPGAVAAPGKQLGLAVYRPEGEQGELPIAVRFELTRAPSPAGPVETVIRAGGETKRVRLSAGQASTSVSLKTTIAPGAARALMTLDSRLATGRGKVPQIAIHNVVIGR